MMDKLRQDVRAVYDRQQAALGEMAGARRRLMATALENRDEPLGGRLQFVAGIAAIALAVIIVATFAYMRANGGIHLAVPPAASPSPLKTAPPPLTTPKAGPAAGFVTLDADLLDASTGWVLLTNCIQPMTGRCHYSVARTADGGRTWSKGVQVGPAYDPTNGDAPRTIRFINARDGFVYGGAEAFVTHDGGRSWKAINVQQTFVASIAGRGDTAWLMTYPCKKGTLCGYQARSSLDGGRTWSSPYSLPVGFSPLQAVTFGSSGLLISSGPAGDMEITLNGGASWRSIKSACVGNPFRAVVATADGNELWEVCLGYSSLQTTHEQIFVSEDGGRSWALRTRSRVTGQQVQDDYSTILESTRPGTVLYASARSTILITHDRGVTWTQAGPNGISFVSIRFANATEGWALDSDKNIWATRDGGDSWTELPA